MASSGGVEILSSVDSGRADGGADGAGNETTRADGANGADSHAVMWQGMGNRVLSWELLICARHACSPLGYEDRDTVSVGADRADTVSGGADE